MKRRNLLKGFVALSALGVIKATAAIPSGHSGLPKWVAFIEPLPWQDDVEFGPKRTLHGELRNTHSGESWKLGTTAYRNGVDDFPIGQNGVTESFAIRRLGMIFDMIPNDCPPFAEIYHYLG